MNQPIVDTVMEEDGLNFHSLNRVKKKINDYIINNYVALFFGGQILPEMIVTEAEILTCQKLLSKVQDELRLSTDAGKKTDEVLRECIHELQEKKFFSQVTIDQDNTQAYKITDLKIAVKYFII